MALPTLFMQQWEMTNPIIQAPMAGGGDTPNLVAAVCNAGGMGTLGAAYLTPAQIEEAALRVREKTSRPFGINLFAPTPVTPTDFAARVQTALERLAPYYQELGLEIPTVPDAIASITKSGAFEAQLAAALNCGASTISFTFGIPSPEYLGEIKNRGLFLMGTATTVEEAIAWEHAGADAIIAQGSEAGGHRGTFAGRFEMSLVGTMALVPQIVDTVSLPVVASGGIMDGRGIVAALALGAQAVQMGTAFLTCHEAGSSEAYKHAILSAREDETRLTRAFSGRPARGIVNRFMSEVESGSLLESEEVILPFPMQNALTRPLRTEAARQNRPEFLSLWAGQGVRLARRQSAAELIARLLDEMERVLRRLSNEA